MKIVVIGGTGFIGTKVVYNLRQSGHEVIAASPANHINTVTKEGLSEALSGADVVVDLSNSPSFDDAAVADFFQQSGYNLLEAEANSGVKHHVVLSIVGIDRMQNIGYMRGKMVQEELVVKSAMPYTIVRSTQFFEFLPVIANAAPQENVVELSEAAFQPIAADDVASFLAQYSLQLPVNRIVEIAGPDRSSIAGLGSQYLQHMGDPRKIIYNPNPAYYGQPISNDALVPVGEAKLGTTGFKKWLYSLPTVA
jgi:uncharacterized protein YbjT (DUF2867 family)